MESFLGSCHSNSRNNRSLLEQLRFIDCLDRIDRCNQVRNGMSTIDRMNSSSRSQGDAASFLDAVSLHLDDFDFLDDRPVSCFSPSNSADLEALLSSVSSHSSQHAHSTLSSGSLMDFDMIEGSLKDSLNACSLEGSCHSHRSHGSKGRSTKPRHSRQQQMMECYRVSEASEASSCSPPQPQLPQQISAPSSSPQPQRRAPNPRFRMAAVDFDPTPCSSLVPPAVSPEQQQQQQVDLQLSKLAASMKRTEESRRCVMLQRELLYTPEQQRQLKETKDELHRRQTAAVQTLSRQRQLQQQQQQQQRPNQACFVSPSPQAQASSALTPTVNTMMTPRPLYPEQYQSHLHQQLSPQDRSSALNSFFVGSRGSLTNGLEQSRLQLGSYMRTV